jgi:S-adenosylmethionine synthetase
LLDILVIGIAEPASIDVGTEETAKIDEERISELVREQFALTPRATMRVLRM